MAPNRRPCWNSPGSLTHSRTQNRREGDSTEDFAGDERRGAKCSFIVFFTLKWNHSLDSSAPFPQLQLLRAKRRRPPFPAVISLIPFLSGRRTDAGDGGGSANRRADVYRLDIYLSRSRLFFPLMVDGGVRVCREGAPPRFAFPDGVGEAKATAALGITSPRSFLAPVAFPSDVSGGAVEFCSGGRGWCFIISFR